MDYMFTAVLWIYFVWLIISIAIYVWSGIETHKVLKHLGYKNAWMAWVPYANRYAVADVIRGDDDQTEVLGHKVPALLFNFWWLAALVVLLVPTIGYLCYVAMSIICLGTCYKDIFARCENKQPEEVSSVAYIAGFLPIIALIKFTGYKFNQVVIDEEA